MRFTRVIKVSDAKELGRHIVVQGGTFYNDGVLRSFERIAGCEAIVLTLPVLWGLSVLPSLPRSATTQKAVKTTMLSIDKINESEIYHLHGQLPRMYQ